MKVRLDYKNINYEKYNAQEIQVLLDLDEDMDKDIQISDEKAYNFKKIKLTVKTG